MTCRVARAIENGTFLTLNWLIVCQAEPSADAVEAQATKLSPLIIKMLYNCQW